MKTNLSITIAVMMFMAVVTITAEAQTSGSQQMRTRIPFAFNVGKTNLRAGEYTVTVVNANSDRKVLQIRSVDGKSSVLIQTSELNTKTPEQTKLVFNQYGSRYFFAQAHMAGESTALAAVKSSEERHEQQAVARKGGKATIVIITV